MATTQWILAFDRRPGDRSVRDVELICGRLRRLESLSRLPQQVISHLAHHAFYEDVERGVTLFRQGDIGTSWYMILAGKVEVRVIQDKSMVTLCTLGVGASFGEGVLQDLPRDSTVITRTSCELLRLTHQDLKALAEKNKEIMNDLISNCKMKNGLGGVVKSQSPSPPLPQAKRGLSPDESDPARPITEGPSMEMARAGWVLRTLLLNEQDEVLRERKTAGGRLSVPKAASGSELVSWLQGMEPGLDRHRATTMWQALLEEGIIFHVSGEHGFKDKCVLYQFRADRDSGGGGGGRPSPQDIAEAEEHLPECLADLADRGPDAWLRMVLRKPSNDRTAEDLEIIYEELVHMKPLGHLSNSMKRELASVIMFEAHPRPGTVVFEQGEEGRSWYLVLCGSVDVAIHGKGVVATLHAGEDFGKLALINEAPRAASIIVREENTHLLRVDKDDFNRILRDVEANTVRLKEHGKDVLVLEKSQGPNSSVKYVVMSCSPARMVEHLLDSRLDSGSIDPALDDFLLTHVIFISTRHLVQELKKHYNMDSPHHDKEQTDTYKRRVLLFVYRWVTTIRHPALSDPIIISLIEELSNDASSEGWEEAALMHRLSAQVARQQEINSNLNKWKLPPTGQPICLFSPSETGSTLIKPKDDIIFRVYCADHTYCTLRLPVSATAEQVKVCAADKLGLRVRPEDLILAELKSNGERVNYRDVDVSVPTSLSLNGRIFVAPKEHLDALTVIPEQEAPTEGVELDLEDVSAKEMAYHMTMFDWGLFWNIHEYELLYHTFGRHRFGQSTANLDAFLRRFNELQYWVVTEICLTQSLSKRVQVLRKIIKLAAYCKQYHNINGMFALVLGLSNMAVSRLSLTWDKLPSKSRKLYMQLEATIDPSKNHRAYRGVVSSMDSPLIPFMPLLLKDMTFIHEGNKTMVDGLVNFEKMHMLAQTLRTLRYCRSRQLIIEDPPTPKNESEVHAYVRCLRTIDNQRTLTSLSQKLEPRRS